jgi:hypothetical protein
LRGPSRKVTTFHFHVENRVEIDILQAAAECTKSLQKMSGWSLIQSDGIWNSEKLWKSSNKIARNEVNFFPKE